MASGRPPVRVLCADQMQHDRMGFVDGWSHTPHVDAERFPTFGHAFRDAGYRTAYFGKMHLYQEIERLGFDEGVDTTHRAVSDADTERLDVHHVPEGLRQDYYAADAAEAWWRRAKAKDAAFYASKPFKQGRFKPRD